MKRLILAAASLAAIACSDATTGGGAGRTRVYLTDSPFPYGSISAVNVYIARIEASATTDTTGLNPQSWVTIATPERTFNLLDFQGGAATLLGEADLQADQYRAVRVVINTGRSSVINSNGSTATVHWPISGDLSLYAIVEQPLAVTSAGAQIVLDFDVGRTFLPDGGGGFYLIPWIRAVNQAATGGITGTVTASSIEGETLPFVNAAVSVYHSGLDDTLPDVFLIPLGTSHSDAQGHYAVAFLPPGSYRVVATDPGFPQRSARKAGVQVTVGGQTRVDLPMVIDTSTGGGTDTTGVDTTGAPSGPVASLSISPATQTISVGDSAVAMAFTLNAQGQTLTGRTITWTVSDSSAVSVTQAAYNWILLRGAKSGSVTLTAKSEGVSATAAVTVR